MTEEPWTFILTVSTDGRALTVRQDCPALRPWMAGHIRSNLNNCLKLNCFLVFPSFLQAIDSHYFFSVSTWNRTRGG